MFNPVKVGKRTRYSYARIKETMEMPHLLDLQRNSYDWFKKEGLQEIFRDISPISDFTGNLELFFENFSFGEPKYSLEECKKRDGTFAAPVRVKVKLLNKSKGEVKEQEVFMGDFPIMTETGTFIINGAERVIVSQLVRSPGAYFDKSIDQNGRLLFSSTIIPNRGAWIELELDANFNISVRIDRTRKMPITFLLRALDFQTNQQIIELFDIPYFVYSRLHELKDSLPVDCPYNPNMINPDDLDEFKNLDNLKLALDFLHDLEPKNPLTGSFQVLVKTLQDEHSTGEDNKEKALIGIYSRLRPGEPPSAENAASLINSLFFEPKRYDLAKVGRHKISKKLGWKKRILNHSLVNNLTINDSYSLPAYSNISQELLDSLPDFLPPNFQNIRINSNFGSFPIFFPTSPDSRNITVPDIIASINYLLALQAGIGSTDDIDHLGNRRVRSVGELLQNQFRIGMTRMERVVKERMTTQDSDILTPQNLINIRPVVAAIKEFFGSSQLSQFMDQHNPLSELTHKRRLSALGPGGLSRERAGFDVRDVHISHYGRMCPIETPEGPNIGLIGSLSTFARVNNFGFIETPYRKVGVRDMGNGTREKFVSSDIVYLTADDEESLVIAQANEPLDDNDWFINERVTARHGEHTSKVPREDVDLMDVSPKQVVSIASALIPFLENDDANRALMGANMQRQAVPLLKTQAPFVGTGMEFKAAKDSGVLVLAKHDGIVSYVDANKIVIKNRKLDITDTYRLKKFVRSNQGTCYNQIPIVNQGQFVLAGQPIADGPSTDGGELALGYNILVAYMPWEGYNYEDAILLSENLIKRDIFTSIHIEEYQCDARDTKLGPEEVTRDIPNLSEDALALLDSEGIISIGSDVQTGDILVGKVTPKGETELTAEERLLRAIFGEKAREVRDSSLRVPHGQAGKVVAVNSFDRSNNDDMPPGVNKQVRVYIAQKRKISVGDKMSGRHGNKGVVSAIRRQEDMPFLPDGTPVDIVLNPLGVPSRMNIGQILETHLGMAVRKSANIIDQINKQILDKNSPLLQKVIQNLINLGYDSSKLNLDDLDNFQLPIPSNGAINISTPVFDGVKDVDLSATMELAEMDQDAKTILYDGRTGLPFHNRVTVGFVYMLKLHHLVDDKIHARSTGPYSLVTQQPLGGKAQFGGQRFGEMEVWALEAYGAAFSLQEILTVKSDDVQGRVKAYEAIVKGQNIPEPGVPESFKVLIKELQSIALDIRVLSKDAKEILILDDEEEDSSVLKKKADDLGVDIGNFANQDVKVDSSGDFNSSDNFHVEDSDGKIDNRE